MLISHRISLALGVLCLALAALAPTALAAGPASVTVRVEGPGETLTLPTLLTTTTMPVVKDGNPSHSCTGTSAAGALELATGGNWNGTFFEGLGYSVEAIEGLSYPFTQPYFWEFWLDNKPATGFCDIELEPGDSLLFFPECFSETAGVCPPSPTPLGIEAQPSAGVNEPITVTVSKYSSAGVGSPASGATVAYEGASTTTDSAGHATLSLAHTGTTLLRVSAPESVRTEAPVCVHNGNDGNCATSGPASPGPGGGAGSGAGSGAVAGFTSAPYKGPFALVADATGPTDGRAYRHGRAPRVLSGRILAHSAVAGVSLELRRKRGERCWSYDGVSERFNRAPCGRGSFFHVSNSAQFSYLLPAALAPGRYVLDIEASDAVGNRTALARGTSRIVFYVR